MPPAPDGPVRSLKNLGARPAAPNASEGYEDTPQPRDPLRVEEISRRRPLTADPADAIDDGAPFPVRGPPAGLSLRLPCQCASGPFSPVPPRAMPTYGVD